MNHPELNSPFGQTEITWDRSLWTIEDVEFDQPWCFCVRASSSAFPERFLAWFPFASKGTIEDARSSLQKGERTLLTLASRNPNLRYVIC